MGISKVVGLSAAALFAAYICARKYGTLLISLPILHASLAGFVVSIASHPCINCQLFGKSSDGKFPLWSIIIFGPFLLFVQVYMFYKKWRRIKRGEPMYDEVHEGLYVGGWPSSSKLLPPGLPAVIDCTCEFPRTSSILKNEYLCIPTWDTRSPSPSDIEWAVRWACKRRMENKPIYVHCANGHGRSVCVICGILVALGVAEDWKTAENIVREKRPFIRMNALHRKNLEEWSKQSWSAKQKATKDASPSGASGS